MHSCDFGACCNPRHLSKGTHQQNMADRGLRYRGYTRKLSEKDIVLLRHLYVKRKRKSDKINSTRKLAAQFGVSKTTMHNYVRSTRKWES